MKQILALTACVFLSVNSFAQSNFIGSGLMMHFDGDPENYYDLGDNYNTLNFPVTFESWVFQEGYSLYTPLFASDSYASGNYYGLYVRFDPTGKLIFEIGNGLGAGGTHRRGKMTTTSAPLNEWIHVAIVATTVTDIKFYFNGVLQPSANTDGGATNSSMVHNSNPVNLGRYATVHRADGFIGYMDEVRLWSVSRSETEIRDKMCEKLTTAEPGLIGYWIVDENTTEPTLEDYSVSNINGSEMGVVDKMNSGAPIGDVSTFSYLPDFTGVSLSLNSPGGDKLKVNKIANAPYGVHIYRVNSLPNTMLGLNEVPAYYYGVFSANNLTDAKYTVTYTYSYSNGVVDAGNEAESTLFKRHDGTINSWMLQPATLTIATKRLTKKNFTGRSEFIFNISEPNQPRSSDELTDSFNAELMIYPNPSSSVINITGLTPGVVYHMYNAFGANVASGIIVGESIQIDISGLTPGVYYFAQGDDMNRSLVSFIKQ